MDWPNNNFDNDNRRRKRRRSPSYDDDRRAEDSRHGLRGETSSGHESDRRYSYRGRRPSPVYEDYGSMQPSLRSYHNSAGIDAEYRIVRWPSKVEEGERGSRHHRRSTSPWEDHSSRQPRRMSTPPPPTTTTTTTNLEPTDEYLSVSLRHSWRLEDPTNSRKLIILDLNGSLLLRSAHPGKRGHDPTRKRLRTVYPRPYLSAFRSYILHEKTRSWLDTMVWSSAQPHSVEDMVEKCFRDRRHELKAIWARDTLGLNNHDYNRKTQTVKDLEKPWAKLSEGHSAFSTLLMDDSPLKAALQPWNHLCIREYIAEMRQLDLSAAEWEASWRRLHNAKYFDATKDEPANGTAGFTRVETELGIEEAMDDPSVTKITKEVVMIHGKMIGEEKLMKKVMREVVMVDGEIVEEQSTGGEQKSVKKVVRELVMVNGEMVGEQTTGREEEISIDQEIPQTKQQKKKKEKRFAKREAVRKAKEEAEKEQELATQQFLEIEEGEVISDDDSVADEVGLLGSRSAAPKYDQTLLAVIGVLDHIKCEGNIAGWIRHGGLLNLDLVDEPQDKANVIRSESPAAKPSPKKKQKLEDGHAVGSVEEVEHDAQPPSSPVLLPPPSSPLSPSNRPLSSPGQPSPEGLTLVRVPSRGDTLDPSPSLWFERSEIFSHWANRGRRALKELNIEAESGILL